MGNMIERYSANRKIIVPNRNVIYAELFFKLTMEITGFFDVKKTYYLFLLYSQFFLFQVFLESRIISNKTQQINSPQVSCTIRNSQIKYSMGAASIEKVNKIPTGLSASSAQKRAVLFGQFDMNGNKYLSLAEIDKGIRDVLDLPELFQTKPVIMRAYQASKTKIKAAHTFGDDYVSKAEFRYLLTYLKQYYSLWLTFDTIETTGDRRLGKQQFINGKSKLEQWGIRVKNPQATFSQLCKKYNAQEQLTFTDFCDWACKEHLKSHPDSEEHDHLY